MKNRCVDNPFDYCAATNPPVTSTPHTTTRIIRGRQVDTTQYTYDCAMAWRSCPFIQHHIERYPLASPLKENGGQKP